MPRSVPGLQKTAERERKTATQRFWCYSSALKCRPETILSKTWNALVLNLKRNTICAVNMGECDNMERVSFPHQRPKRHRSAGISVQVFRENVPSLLKSGGPATGIGHTMHSMEQVLSIPAGWRQECPRLATKYSQTCDKDRHTHNIPPYPVLHFRT